MASLMTTSEHHRGRTLPSPSSQWLRVSAPRKITPPSSKPCAQFLFPFQLWLVGDGPLLDQMRALTVRLGLADRVSFHGNSSSVPRILQQTHIFALISRYEGLPISILEAMRAGLPVVATDTGGVSEAVRHGWNGLLSPRRDPVALRSNLERLLGDSQLRGDYGNKSRLEYERRFRPQSMLSATFEVYNRFLPSTAG